MGGLLLQVLVIDHCLQMQTQRQDPNAMYGTVDGEGIYATADDDGKYNNMVCSVEAWKIQM